MNGDVIAIGILRWVPDVLLSSVDVGTWSVSDIEGVSSARASLLTTLMVEVRGLSLSVIVDVVVAVVRSNPVAAASLVCINKGTPAVLTQGRTVNCLLGRSKTKDQLKHKREG